MESQQISDPMSAEEAQELADGIGCCPEHDEMVKRLVRDYLAERERCAKIAEEELKSAIDRGWCAACEYIAAAIRSGK